MLLQHTNDWPNPNNEHMNKIYRSTNLSTQIGTKIMVYLIHKCMIFNCNKSIIFENEAIPSWFYWKLEQTRGTIFLLCMEVVNQIQPLLSILWNVSLVYNQNEGTSKNDQRKTTNMAFKYRLFTNLLEVWP
jgi:hypothetical protein